MSNKHLDPTIKNLRSSFGPQAPSTKGNAPSFGFGVSKRADSDKMYISFSHTRPLFGRGSPGPGSQGSHNSSIGKQTSSKKKTAPSASMGGTGARIKDYTFIKDAVPGPGSYNA